MKIIRAYQISTLGVPQKTLGVREFTEKEWQELMKFYKDRDVKPRWKKINTIQDGK